MNIIAIDLAKFNSAACIDNQQTLINGSDEVESIDEKAAIN